MLFVLVLNVVEDLNGFLNRRGFDQYLLETTLQRAVLFNVLTVFVQSRRTDALNLTACKCRLKHVGCVQ